MTNEQILFAVFCIESVAEKLGVNGATVYKKLTQDSKILEAYILAYYDVLHTQGKEYLIDDIVGYMQKENVL